MHRLSIVVLGAFILLCASSAFGAGVPQKINYQAVLLDDLGDPVTDMVNITFRIHDDAVLATVLWQQTITGIQPDDNGQFSVVLGDEMNPITEDILTGEQRWLGIQVDGDPDEMSPRTELVSSTYSFRVNTVDGAAAGTIYGPLTVEESLAKAADAEVIVSCSAKSPYSVQISPCNGTVLKAMDGADAIGEWGILAPGQSYIGMTDFSAKAAGASVQIKAPSAGLPDAFTIANSSGDETFQIVSDGNSASVNCYSAGVKAASLKARVATEGFALFGDTESDEVLNIGETSPGVATATWTDYTAKAAGASVSIKAPTGGLPDAFTIANSNGDETFQIASEDSIASVSFYHSAGIKAAHLRARVGTEGFALFGDTESDEVLNIGQETPGLATATFTDYTAKAAGASVSIKAPSAGLPDAFTIANSSGEPTFQIESDPSGAASMSFQGAGVKATDRLLINSEGIFFLDEAKSDTLAKITKLGNILAKGQIAMGNNTLTSSFSTVLGHWNEAENETSVVIGFDNIGRGYASGVSGGLHNIADGFASGIGGGSGNETKMAAGAIAGGSDNTTYGQWCTVAGGNSNQAGLAAKGPHADPKLDQYATVGGGGGNVASNQNATVAGGLDNHATGAHSTVSGGNENHATGAGCVVSGGSQNWAANTSATVGGGGANFAGGLGSVIAGGLYCTVDSSAWSASIGGGKYHRAEGAYSVIGGGGGDDSTHRNVASGYNSTIPGGRANVAAASGSFAAGNMARANHQGTMVFAAHWPAADSVMSGGAEQIVMRAAGCLYLTKFGGTAPYDTTKLINTHTGAYLSTGGTWTNATKKSGLRGDITPLDGKQVLEKLSQLPVGEWSSKWEEEGIKHIGPMAEDFHAQFGVGRDDGSISTIDPAGIALVAIQELYRTQQELKQRTEEVLALKTQLDQANLQLSQLAAAVETILATQSQTDSDEEKLALNR